MGKEVIKYYSSKVTDEGFMTDVGLHLPIFLRLTVLLTKIGNCFFFF